MLPARPSMMSLDGLWEFIPDPDRRLAPDRLPAGVPITVPGAWEAHLADPQGIVHGWYRRRFTLPHNSPDGSLMLRFDAVMRRARIWLDRRLVAERDDGSLPFEVDAGEARPGATHDLAVAVDNPFNALTAFPAFDRSAWRLLDARLDGESLERLPAGKQTWYSSTSGLIGSVWAGVAPGVRLAAISVRPEADAGKVAVRWSLAAASMNGGPQTVDLALTAPSGATVRERSVDATAGEATLDVANPERWDLWQPALYRLNLELRGNGGHDVLDEASVRFGIRSLTVADGRVVLNRRPIYLRGVLDQDFWPVGRSNPPSREALAAQVRLARGMGLNLLRCHIKVPSADYLDVADEAGMLVWCELPSWSRFDPEVGRRARDLLGAMVDALGHHPSLIAWTIVNEDWGTDLRRSARDRRWLAATATWLKARDPSRLVVDNSACETQHGPNFHLRTDLADFHAYRSMPDGLGRWKDLVRDFASRPAWLWSPHDDGAPTGHEPLVLSEFGGWGLPRPSAVRARDGGEPWWWSTGLAFRRPAGLERRFQEHGLGRIWPDPDALATATQWQQFEGLASQVRELRRHGAIGGYVITELSDAFWEANGLLDVERGRKAFHDRLPEINADDVLIVELPRSDLWSGERLRCEVLLASHPDHDRGEEAGGPGRLKWRLRLHGGRATSGSSLPIAGRPGREVHRVAELEIEVPEADAALEGEFLASAVLSTGRRAVHRQRVVAIPGVGRRSLAPRRVAVRDRRDMGAIAARLRALGHAIVPTDEAEVVVATDLDAALVAVADGGRSVLVLARSADAIPAGVGLARRVSVVSRQPGDELDTINAPWDGDWSSVFAWALPGAAPGLPDGGLLGEAHAEVYPDHVIIGLDVADPNDGVTIGMFSGWIHSPATILASFAQGAGAVTLTTLRLAPEAGPVAAAFLESILQATAARRPGDVRG